MFSQLNEKENINASKSDDNDDKQGKIKFKSAFKLYKLDNYLLFVTIFKCNRRTVPQMAEWVGADSYSIRM